MADGSAAATVVMRGVGEVSSDSDHNEEEVVKAVSSTDYYDETLDDQNDAWAEKQRQGRKSDAVLTCPACFTTLCIDCQRHEKYLHQYRAMFVLNCKIVENERLKLPPHQQGRRKNRKSKRAAAAINTQGGAEAEAEETEPQDEVYKPVRCSVCETEVAVIDKDEVCSGCGGCCCSRSTFG